MRVVAIALLAAACSPSTGGGNGTVDAATSSVDAPNGHPGFPDCNPASSTACNGNDVVTCNSDGTFGSTVMTCGSGQACSGTGTCTNACTADGVDLIYTVDEANHFLSFDPRKLPGDPFTLIGTLHCPTTMGTIQSPPGNVMPFSMSVDRDGKAWVLYTSGEVFNVSLTDASCTASGYTPDAGGMALFGMGFVSDAVDSDKEKLFIAGGGHSAEPNGELAYVDTHAGNYAPVNAGSIAGSSDFSPELTGTNEAKLYGFFPVLSTPAYVQEIDRATGAAVGQQLKLGTSGLGASIRDWAFAQWGGVFYIFVTTTDASGGNIVSKVHAIDRATGAYSVAIANSQYQVDGAGVSTCAPSILQ